MRWNEYSATPAPSTPKALMPKKASRRRPRTPNRDSIPVLDTASPDRDECDGTNKSSGLISVGEFQGARIQITPLREVGPMGGSPPKTDVALINAARRGILLSGFRYDFAAGLS